MIYGSRPGKGRASRPDCNSRHHDSPGASTHYVFALAILSMQDAVLGIPEYWADNDSGSREATVRVTIVSLFDWVLCCCVMSQA